jgi:hopanoid biosynthesis associated protein HpnK
LKQLIVNADDFGLTAGVNQGIVSAFRDGIVTSTTLMAAGAAFDDAAALARLHPGLSVGCHLTLLGTAPTAPPAEVTTLAACGRLPETLPRLMALLMRGRIASGDIEREFQAQVEKVMVAGITPTHLDTHKHTHAHPKVMEALCRVAARVGVRWVRLPIERPSWIQIARIEGWRRRRIYAAQTLLAAAAAFLARHARGEVDRCGMRTPDNLRGVALTGLLDSFTLPAVLRSLKPGVTELACHPGMWDPTLEGTRTRLKMERQREVEALTDPAVRVILKEEGIHLIGYRDLG